MSTIVAPTTRSNWVNKLKTFIDKKKEQTKAGPVVPVTRMPSELSKLSREGGNRNANHRRG